jgi:hypothetical protein
MENKNNNSIKIVTCIICKIELTKKNTNIEGSKKYSKYNKIICANCFKDYYP